MICIDCKSDKLEIADDDRMIICRQCGSASRIINNVPCCVADELASFSEVAPEKRANFLEAKQLAYFAKSPISALYNHYHKYAAFRRLQVGKTPRTLDIGFGIGEHYPFVTEAERQNRSFIGIDLDRFKLEYFTATHPELPVLQADLFNLPFADHCMEVVQILATLEHFPLPEIGKILDEALRTLKPGGVLIVCYPAEGGVFLRICQLLMHILIRMKTGFNLESEQMHRHRASAREIRRLLGKRTDLERSDTRNYPFNITSISLALFVNEQYRKTASPVVN